VPRDPCPRHRRSSRRSALSQYQPATLGTGGDRCGACGVRSGDRHRGGASSAVVVSSVITTRSTSIPVSRPGRPVDTVGSRSEMHGRRLTGLHVDRPPALSSSESLRGDLDAQRLAVDGHEVGTTLRFRSARPGERQSMARLARRWPPAERWARHSVGRWSYADRSRRPSASSSRRSPMER
jgi:hypothetical protein